MNHCETFLRQVCDPSTSVFEISCKNQTTDKHTNATENATHATIIVGVDNNVSTLALRYIL